MRLSKTLLGLSAGLSAVMASPLSGMKLFRRNGTEDMQDFKGAVLMKNGEQTSCEVALMYSSYGFVPAACLDYTDDAGKSLNSSTIYEVMVSEGLTMPYGRFRVSQVTPNPGYDPESYANNIAIVQFESNGVGEFVNYIASWRQDWENMYFVRRSLNQGGSMWNQPVTTASPAAAASVALSECAAASPLFMYNQNDLLCNTLSTPNVFNATCTIPYGSVYGVSNPDAAIAALYSHSAIRGEGNFCNGNTIYNYYIVMQNYIHWAMSVIGTKAPVYHTRIPEYSENLDPAYSMVIPNPKSIEGVNVYGGDLYHLNETTAEGAAAEEEDEGGLSPGAIAGILLALLALLALLGWFLYRKLREKYANTRVRRWWAWGRFNKDEKFEDFHAQAPDPNDPHNPTTYPQPSYHPDEYQGNPHSLERHSDDQQQRPGNHPVHF
ncbi:hypothetical protein GGF46_004456 [Coemansia sp. RSA 552]|nr:hypothetical protein GGF46_004456 [Coemansia sp. RSA 552]